MRASSFLESQENVSSPIKVSNFLEGIEEKPKKGLASRAMDLGLGTIETAGKLAEMPLKFHPIIAGPTLGLRGLGEMLGGKTGEKAKVIAETIEKPITIEPKTEIGKGAIEKIEWPFKKLDELAEWAVDYVREKTQPVIGETGAALAGTTAGTALKFLPYALGFRHAVRPGFKGESKPIIEGQLRFEELAKPIEVSPELRRPALPPGIGFELKEPLPKTVLRTSPSPRGKAVEISPEGEPIYPEGMKPVIEKLPLTEEQKIKIPVVTSEGKTVGIKPHKATEFLEGKTKPTKAESPTVETLPKSALEGTPLMEAVKKEEIIKPKNTEEAHVKGKELTKEEAISKWEEYKSNISKPLPEDPQSAMNVSFDNQMLKETVESYLGFDKLESLTPDQIEKKLYGEEKAKPKLGVFKISEKGAIQIPTKEIISEVGERVFPKEKRESIYQNLINRFNSIENTVEKAKKLGADIPPGLDAGKRAREYLGIGGKVKSTLEDSTFRITREGKIEKTGEGLKPILMDYDKLSPEKDYKIRQSEFNDYLTSTRTIEDLQRPKSEWTEELIVTPEQVEKARDKIEFLKGKYGNVNHFETIATRLYDYQRRVLHQLVDSGNLSEERYQTILGKNPHYVPFDRILEDIETTLSGTPKAKKPFTEARTPLKKIKGSELEIHNVVESIIKNTYKIMDVAERNTVAKSIARLSSIKELGINEIKPKIIPKGKVRVEGEELQAWGKSPFAPKGNVIEYFDNGEKKYIEVPKNLYKSMTGLDETSAGLLTKIMSLPAYTLRTGATITPEFVLRNPIRDQLTALMQTNFGFRPFLDTTGAIADILGKSDVYYDWLRSGGAHSTFTELSRKNLQKVATDLTKNGLRLKHLNIISDAQDISQFFEQATRVGAYKRAVKAGKTPMEASFESREATIDFARRGSSTKDINQVIAFFNAGIQGTDKFVRTAWNQPGQTALKGTATITIPSLITYLLNREEPDYKEIPRWQKDLFWMFKTGEIWVRIPKPFLFGQVFGSVPERFFEYLDTKDPESFKNLEKSLIDAATPVQGDPNAVLLPTAIKPLIENSANWQFFRERPVVGKRESEFMPFKQYGKYTTETAKVIGKGLGYSPAKIENLMRGYLGGTGQYALEGSDIALEKLGIVSPKESRRPKELADYPLIKGFVSRPPESQPESLEKFYEKSSELSEAYKSYIDSLKNIKSDDAKYIINKYPKLFVSPTIEGFKKNISMINKQIEIITKSDMPELSKRSKIKQAEILRLKISQQANNIMGK